tara:strand:- start:919 stop:1125 length:207 start_codon:yes stop_codon:yes gene_type:complete
MADTKYISTFEDLEQLEKAMKKLYSEETNKERSFIATVYCSRDQFMNLENGADVFHIACMREIGISEE